jgi:hypothetical protein
MGLESSAGIQDNQSNVRGTYFYILTRSLRCTTHFGKGITYPAALFFGGKRSHKNQVNSVTRDDRGFNKCT